MTPPSFPLVPSLMSGWLEDVDRFQQRAESGDLALVDLPEELARLHVDFERIHPFIDGNGRTGRLLLNLILIRSGWPPAIIFKRDRQKYLRAMEWADGGDYGPLAELICRSVIDNLHFLIPSIAGPVKYVPLQALADEELSVSALRQAIQRGRLDARLGTDGTYRTSRQAVDAYKASRYRRRKDAAPDQ